MLALTVFERDHPPVFRLRAVEGALPGAGSVEIETIRPGGERQVFAMEAHDGWLEGAVAIPEPHAFVAQVLVDGEAHAVTFEEHGHGGEGHSHGGATGRDNNMRAAIVHVLADAAVSVLVIAGLILARVFGWLWMTRWPGWQGRSSSGVGPTVWCGTRARSCWT